MQLLLTEKSTFLFITLGRMKSSGLFVILKFLFFTQKQKRQTIEQKLQIQCLFEELIFESAYFNNLQQSVLPFIKGQAI